MDEQQLQRMLDTACRIGDMHSARAIRHANEIRILRGVIWRALCLLRAGQTDKARCVLERELAKDSSA